jgi:hypothetical protein
MAQPWGISRLNGEIGTLQARFERAGAGLAQMRELRSTRDAAPLAGQRSAEVLGEQHLNRMRIVLWMTAVSALAVLILMLL